MIHTIADTTCHLGAHLLQLLWLSQHSIVFNEIAIMDVLQFYDEKKQQLYTRLHVQIPFKATCPLYQVTKEEFSACIPIRSSQFGHKGCILLTGAGHS